MHTSDLADGGEVEGNIAHNFRLNGRPPPLHVTHTWGAGWPRGLRRYRYVIASDILLYVSAYPALVQTLWELFAPAGAAGRGKEAEAVAEAEAAAAADVRCEEFVMVWNRRMDASKAFFELMQQRGFACSHHGQCVYSFSLA